MPRGGRRAGAPGKSYGQRTDLLTNRQPMPGSMAAPVPQPQPGPAQPAQPTMSGAPAAGPSTLPQLPLRQPGTLGPAQVNEPLTHGLPTGPGAGPEVLNLPSVSQDPLDRLRAIYLQYPTEALRQLIQFNSTGGA